MASYSQLTSAILDAEARVESCEEELSIAKALLRDRNKQLLRAIEEGSVPPRFDAHGRSWSYDSTTIIKPVDKNATDAVVEWIKEHGGESLVKPSMHAASRDKFLRETLIDSDDNVNIPDELVGLVVSDSIPKIKTRKL